MAAHRMFATTESPSILIEQVDGDLTLRGWSRAEIFVRSDEGSDEIVQTETGVRVRLHDDAVLEVPLGASVTVHRAHGDVSVAAINGPLTLDKVDGDVVVRDGGPLRVVSVDGDLTARMIRGDCVIENVSGDVTLTNILGSVKVENAASDVTINDVRSGVRVRAGNDVSLRLLLMPGEHYDINAGNDITCRIQAQVNARVQIEAIGDISVRRFDLPPQRYSHSASFDLGSGEEGTRSTLMLRAGDDVSLTGLSFEELGDLTLEMGADMGMRAAELAQHIAAQIEASLGSVARQLDEKFSKLSTNEELAARIQEKVQSALRKAEERVAEAMRSAEARTKEAERRAAEAEKQRGRSGFPGAGWPPPPPPPPPRPPKAPRPPASEEERMAVLRMVSEGKISVEQAEKLLSALNGQQPPADR